MLKISINISDTSLDLIRDEWDHREGIKHTNQEVAEFVKMYLYGQMLEIVHDGDACLEALSATGNLAEPIV